MVLMNLFAGSAKLLQSCLTLCDPRDGSPPGSPSLGFSRQEHWSGVPLPSPPRLRSATLITSVLIFTSTNPSGIGGFYGLDYCHFP